MMKNGKRVPFEGQECSRRADGWLVGTGNFRRDGYLIAGPRYDRIMASSEGQRLARRYAFRAEHPVLSTIARIPLLVLKVIWKILCVIGAIVMVVDTIRAIHDVEQTFSGPNSIANTNRNINNYISRQNQRR